MKHFIAVLCLASLMIVSFTLYRPLCAEEQEREETAQDEGAQPEAVMAQQVLTVAEYALCENVVDRQPVGEKTAFSPAVEKVYFWTKITGAEEPTEIKHVWYRDGIQIADITLAIQYPRHRTWSYKTILPEMAGNWSVEILDSNAKVLKKVNFSIAAEPAMNEQSAEEKGDMEEAEEETQEEPAEEETKE